MKHEKVKVNTRMKVFKCLVRVTWGSTQDALNTTYKTYIKRVIIYGREVLVTLEKCRSNALRLICIARKTNSVPATQL